MSARSALPDLVAMDTVGRAGAVLDRLDAAGIDALVITKGLNLRWLTGFTGSNGLLVVTDDGLTLVTDGRYREQADRQLGEAGVEATVVITVTEVADAVAGAVGGRARIGLEAGHVTWQRRDQIDGWLPDATLVPTVGLVEELRKVKDPGELSRLERAAAMADVALAEVAPLLAGRPTEAEIANRLDRAMVDQGADGPAYDTIVASGPNAALPHASPGSRVIEPGDLVIIDVGARLDGYGSDMTRTLVAGGEPSAEQQHWYDVVADAQAAGVAAVRAGAPERSIDDSCRAILSVHGLEDALIHGTGHGIGLEIHEEPILSPRSEGILRAGLVVTVEPGVYFPGRGGVRVEDSVVVGVDGCRSITHSPKGLAP